MQFNSITFLIFLFVIVVLYYIIPQKYKNGFLLLSSYYFYFSAKPEYLLLLLTSTAVNYASAYLLETKQDKKPILVISLLFNIGILFCFKYLNFVDSQLNSVFRQFSINLHIPAFSIILPIGISFYTFMAIGYILDIYWGDRKRDKNYLLFSLYLAFFPQILCGPIGRAKDLIPQFTAKPVFKYDDFSNGFRLMLWGFFKKLVVADNLGVYVDAVFNNIPMHSSLTVIVATFFYAFQLYADFSGYSDIARGVARLFGIKLMVNFRTPYVSSTSVSDYWNRNHISLTSWLRDYVFYPFIGTNTSKLKIYIGIVLMFTLSGIWHGAGWTFIIWGLIQAFYLITEDALHLGAKKDTSGFMLIIRKIVTFVLVSISLLFFRLPNLTQFKNYISSIAKNDWNIYIVSKQTIYSLLIGLFILVIYDLNMNKKQFDEFLMPKTLLHRWTVYICMLLLIICLGNVNGSSFIYFQF
jgi:alginate O-acetyltransferase complex protein AlgI